MSETKLRQVLDQLVAREQAANFGSPMERMQASLHEWSRDDITDFVTTSINGANAITGGDPIRYAISLLTIGLEVGRELERRI